MEKEIGKIVGEGKAYADINEVPESEKLRIQTVVKEAIKKDGTGAFDKNGNKTKVTEEIIEETLNDTIQNSSSPLFMPAIFNGKKSSMAGLRFKGGADLTFNKQATTKGKKFLHSVQRLAVEASSKINK